MKSPNFRSSPKSYLSYLYTWSEFYKPTCRLLLSLKLDTVGHRWRGGRGVLTLVIKFHSHSNWAFEQTFLSTRIARHRAKKRRGKDGSQETGELQAFHSYTKPGPGVRVPASADNFFHFLILQHSYIHELRPWGGSPTFPTPVFLAPLEPQA